jgi:hypothetical protein
MENCLVVKLKGTVNDNTLPVIGEMRFEITSTPAGNTGFDVASSVQQTLKILTNGVSFVGGGNTYEITKLNTPINLQVTAPCVIAIEDKYHFTRFSQGNTGARMAFSIEELSYMPINVIILNVSDKNNNNNITGNIKALPEGILYFRVKRGNFEGLFEELPSGLIELELTGALKVGGCISNYVSDSITKVFISGCDNINGSFEYLCQNAINAGRTSGTLQLTHSPKTKVVNQLGGGSTISYATFSSTGCVIGSSSGASDIASCVKSGTAGNYTFTWTDGNGNTYVPDKN